MCTRLSFAPNGETVKVDDQMEMGREEIERRGGVVGQVFPGNSRSAWKPNVVRPQWNALMQRLEAGASNGVWVYDVTRFSRKVLEGERLVQLATTGEGGAPTRLALTRRAHPPRPPPPPPKPSLPCPAARSSVPGRRVKGAHGVATRALRAP